MTAEFRQFKKFHTCLTSRRTTSGALIGDLVLLFCIHSIPLQEKSRTGDAICQTGIFNDSIGGCFTAKRNTRDTNDNVYGAVIMARPCESSPGSFDECKLSARWLPILKPSQPIWPVSSPVGCCHPHPPSPFVTITQPDSRYSFYVPRRVEG